mmetsp:Transcript_8018/g.11879  ORF Transcript_8018/g.11879 Transcript_8018/m.11879 type:complete len:271 (+) Transcript_8018:2673-3485(+)
MSSIFENWRSSILSWTSPSKGASKSFTSSLVRIAMQWMRTTEPIFSESIDLLSISGTFGDSVARVFSMLGKISLGFGSVDSSSIRRCTSEILPGRSHPSPSFKRCSIAVPSCIKSRLGIQLTSSNSYHAARLSNPVASSSFSAANTFAISPLAIDSSASFQDAGTLLSPSMSGRLSRLSTSVFSSLRRPTAFMTMSSPTSALCHPSPSRRVTHPSSLKPTTLCFSCSPIMGSRRVGEHLQLALYSKPRTGSIRKPAQEEVSHVLNQLEIN